MDSSEILNALLGPVIVVLVAIALTSLVFMLTRRFESHYLEHDEGEVARVARLQRGISNPNDAARGLRRKRALTISSLVRGLAVIVIWIGAVVAILEMSGLPIASLLAVVGVAGIALSFGAQSIVKDFLSGFFILMERQYDVGDTIQIAGVAGTVQSLELRATVLRDLEGRRHVVPNGEIRVSTNCTHVFSRYPIILPVPYDEDVERVIEIAENTARELRATEIGALITEDLSVLGVDEFADSSVKVRLYLQTVPGRQWEVGREYRKCLKAALDEAGISMPYPTREVLLR